MLNKQENSQSKNLSGGKMVRLSRTLLKEAGNGINKTLSEILVCPLSKQPLRICEATNSLISDAIGVSYPVSRNKFLSLYSTFKTPLASLELLIKDGIPCLVPLDGKILETDEEKKQDSVATDSSFTKQ
ncbi:protein preY, mitochondrial isoform X1 [Ricinus communis]|uniref:protein preY, mitochondrial isoform X1 n=1 Tax=Ricinus communis TaxID=3988 RepID=UPI00201AF68E|nr:protein preY, mitochondrial isoform X1 [Ricinus communis]